MYTSIYHNILLVHICEQIMCKHLQNDSLFNSHDVQLIAMLEKNDKKWKRMSVDEQLRLERMTDRKDSFLGGMPESGDADFNVNIFRNMTVEQVLMENGRYGILNVYRRYADDFRRLITEITEAAKTSREIRARLVNEFHGGLRQLIDGGVDESRKSANNWVLHFIFNKPIKKPLCTILYFNSPCHVHWQLRKYEKICENLICSKSTVRLGSVIYES
ncbi:hypothetical protein QTP88_019765 [Uroleucon formosanum]